MKNLYSYNSVEYSILQKMCYELNWLTVKMFVLL